MVSNSSGYCFLCGFVESKCVNKVDVLDSTVLQISHSNFRISSAERCATFWQYLSILYFKYPLLELSTIPWEKNNNEPISSFSCIIAIIVIRQLRRWRLKTVEVRLCLLLFSMNKITFPRQSKLTTLNSAKSLRQTGRALESGWWGVEGRYCHLSGLVRPRIALT